MIARLVSALLVFVIASAITGGLVYWLNSAYPDGFTNEALLYGIYAGVWLLLMFIGFRISQRFLRKSINADVK